MGLIRIDFTSGGLNHLIFNIFVRLGSQDNLFCSKYFERHRSRRRLRHKTLSDYKGRKQTVTADLRQADYLFFHQHTHARG